MSRFGLEIYGFQSPENRILRIAAAMDWVAMGGAGGIAFLAAKSGASRHKGM